MVGILYMARPDYQSIDGTERERFYWDDMTLHRVHDSLNETAIMAENQALRADGGARTLSFGKMQLQMSYAQYLWLQRKYPALKSRDMKERTRAWQRIATDIDYLKLRVF
jgi:hypothetical protein